MTLEEKIAHLQETVMTEARSEGNAIIDNHKKALESLFEKHKKEATAQSEVCLLYTSPSPRDRG